MKANKDEDSLVKLLNENKRSFKITSSCIFKMGALQIAMIECLIPTIHALSIIVSSFTKN